MRSGLCVSGGSPRARPAIILLLPLSRNDIVSSMLGFITFFFLHSSYAAHPFAWVLFSLFLYSLLTFSSLISISQSFSLSLYIYLSLSILMGFRHSTTTTTTNSVACNFKNGSLLRATISCFGIRVRQIPTHTFNLLSHHSTFLAISDPLVHGTLCLLCATLVPYLSFLLRSLNLMCFSGIS